MGYRFDGGMEKLEGRVVREVRQDPDGGDLYFVTDTGPLAFEAYGDCCAHAYFYQVEGMDEILGRPILSVEEGETTCTEQGREYLDAFFVTIKTDRGRATAELRTEHNGYYSGMARNVDPPPQDTSKWRVLATTPHPLARPRT